MFTGIVEEKSTMLVEKVEDQRWPWKVIVANFDDGLGDDELVVAFNKNSLGLDPMAVRTAILEAKL